jgi:hypothetical protein
MPTGYYLTHPGLDLLDDAHVYDTAGRSLGYEALMQELGPAARTAVMNYPPELLKRGVLDAQILSFSRCRGRTVLARVYLGCKDALGRQIPVTELFLGEELSWLEILALEPVLPRGLNRPPWPTPTVKCSGWLRVRTPGEVADWNREWKEAFQEAADAFQGGRQGPWVSLCFDRVQFLPFSDGRLYPSKKKLTERRGLILAGLGLLMMLGLAMLFGGWR